MGEPPKSLSGDGAVLVAARFPLPKKLLWLGLGAILLAGIFVRLGIWQLDRLAQRRAYNASLTERVSAPVLQLNQGGIPADPASVEFRTAEATGRYDFADQVALRSLNPGGQLGVELITPLVLEGSNQAVLVDRGWIPISDLARQTWGKFDQAGMVTVRGMLRMGQAGSGQVVPVTGGAGSAQEVWTSLSIPAVARQVQEPLLPFYLAAQPDPSAPALPARSPATLTLGDGPHLGYAIEWFTFAAAVLIGYLFLARRRLRQQPEE